AKTALDFVSLRYSFLDDSSGLQENTDFLETDRNLDNKLPVVDVVLRQIPVAQVNTPFEIGIVGGHVVCADLIVYSHTWTADRGDDIGARLKLGNIRANSFNTPETFVTQHQEVITRRSRAVFRSIDFLVGTVDTNAEHLDKNAAAVR